MRDWDVDRVVRRWSSHGSSNEGAVVVELERGSEVYSCELKTVRGWQKRRVRDG